MDGVEARVRVVDWTAKIGACPEFFRIQIQSIPKMDFHAQLQKPLKQIEPINLNFALAEHHLVVFVCKGSN
jgi:hypothetical protein